MVKTFVFWGRLALYYILMLLPLAHPGLMIYGDGFFLFKALFALPASALLAWFGPRLGQLTLPLLQRPLARSHLAALLLPLPVLPFAGFTLPMGELLLLMYFAYFSSWLLINRKLGQLLYLDAFYFASRIIRMLSLTRSSQDTAALSIGFSLGAVLLLAAGFAAYAYLASRAIALQGGRSSRKRELPSAAAGLAALGLALVLFLPPDFAENLQVFNGLQDIIQPRLRNVDGDSNSPEGGGNLTGDASKGGNGDQGELLLMSPGRWGQQPGNGEGGALENQYMVMVVESPTSPVYLADEYFNHLDQVEGFYSDPSFPYNQLVNSQYLETWENPDPVPLRNRRPVWIEVFSTIPDKVLSYDPFQVEPTIRDTSFYPLSYQYRARSLISNISLLNTLPPAGELLRTEREELQEYLAIDLADEDRARFQSRLDEILDGSESYRDRIQKLLESYSPYQYELGFTDDVSVDAISRFLFESYSGDCTEFSNSAAILGRLAGIPSRVVTGYLVSDGLQLAQHRQAIARLQEQHPQLAEKSADDLYLVTTVHRHSWVQYYIPVFGWVDIEATSYAIPPAGTMDPNQLNVVIPDLRERTVLQQRLPIPWGLVFNLALIITASALGLLFLNRWIRIIVLSSLARRPDRRGARALYRLLILRLRSRGYELKARDAAPGEWAIVHPELGPFIGLYKSMLYGSHSQSRQYELMEELRREYRLLARQGKPLSGLRFLFSIRDMRYLS